MFSNTWRIIDLNRNLKIWIYFDFIIIVGILLEVPEIFPQIFKTFWSINMVTYFGIWSFWKFPTSKSYEILICKNCDILKNHDQYVSWLCLEQKAGTNKIIRPLPTRFLGSCDSILLTKFLSLSIIWFFFPIVIHCCFLEYL